MAKSPLESGGRGRRLRIILIADRATRPCAEGKIISNEIGIGVWENRPLALKTRNASILVGRFGKTRVASRRPLTKELR